MGNKSPSLPTSINTPKRAFKDAYELQKESCNRKIQVLASQIHDLEKKPRASTQDSNKTQEIIQQQQMQHPQNIQNIRREFTDWIKKSSKDSDYTAEYAMCVPTDRKKRNRNLHALTGRDYLNLGKHYLDKYNRYL